MVVRKGEIYLETLPALLKLLLEDPLSQLLHCLTLVVLLGHQLVADRGEGNEGG
jgi:hypothetical protein